MRIAILNYADVRNFGDVLFPLIVVREISARLPSAKFEFVTPTGSSWGGMESMRLDQVQLDRFDAILLGGGEIVHRYDSMLAGIYSRFGLQCIDRPTDLVFGWTRTSGPFKAWIALGVPALTPDSSAAISDAVHSLDFLGVRGSYSARRCISESADLTTVGTSPDLGWLFPRLLENHKSGTVHPANGHPYIVIQALEFPDVAATTRALKRISRKTGLKIVLLPLTRCWQDVRPLDDLYENSDKEFFLVEDAMSDLDKLSILGRSSLYLGQSMHGLIGTLSQCRPAGILMPLLNDKFGELLSDADLLYCQASGWDEAERLTDTLIRIPLNHIMERRLSFERELDGMFDSLCARIQARGVSPRILRTGT